MKTLFELINHKVLPADQVLWNSEVVVQFFDLACNVLCCSIECMYRVYIESGPPVLLVDIYL